MSDLMRWPGTTDKSEKPDLSKLSDDELDERMVEAGLMEQDHLDRQRDSLLLMALANLPGGVPDYYDTLAGLMKLRDEGPFPFEAQDLYDRLRARAVADRQAARKAAPKVTPSPADVALDTSMAGWLRARWSSADEVVRNALQAVASTVGVSIPMSRTRTRSVAAKDSSPTRRSEFTRHPNHDESESLESLPEDVPDNDDGPQWHDDDADGWEPCTSLHDALHPDDSEWY